VSVFFHDLTVGRSVRIGEALESDELGLPKHPACSTAEYQTTNRQPLDAMKIGG
jgi:hypothetical protein